MFNIRWIIDHARFHHVVYTSRRGLLNTISLIEAYINLGSSPSIPLSRSLPGSSPSMSNIGINSFIPVKTAGASGAC